MSATAFHRLPAAIALALITTIAPAASAADPGASLAIANYFATQNFLRGSEIVVRVSFTAARNVLPGDKVAVWDPATKAVYAAAALSLPVVGTPTVKLVLDNPASVGPQLELAYLRPGPLGNQALATGQQLRVYANASFDGLAAQTLVLNDTFSAFRAQATNVMETLTVILRDSVRQMNLDKAYYLSKIADLNAASAKLSEYQAALSAKADQLADQEEQDGVKLGLHDDQLADHHARIVELKDAAMRLDAKIANAEAHLAAIKDEIADQTKTVLDDFQRMILERLATLTTRADDHEGRIAALEGRSSYVADQTANNTGCDALVVDVSCEGDDVATGGGCDLGDGDGWRLVRSAVFTREEDGTPSGWSCRLRADDTSACPFVEVEATVVCQPR